MMLSGGIDSTYVLARLLRETDDEILVHHVHFLNNSNRHIPEAAACKKIVDYCRTSYRDFSYTETAIDHRRLVAHGFDVIAAGFEAGVIASSFHIATGRNVDRWFIGLAADDVTMPRVRAKQGQECCEFNCQSGYPPDLHLYPLVGLQTQIDYLPADLYELTWSCRTPKIEGEAHSACGECSSCLRRVGTSRSLGAAHLGASKPMTPLGWKQVLQRPVDPRLRP
ncbi:MAG: hypothetical protein K0Q70_1173 [Rhodospirillales bacterium]|nr:hypothetical protein [Rhodospirillales bacterium]